MNCMFTLSTECSYLLHVRRMSRIRWRKSSCLWSPRRLLGPSRHVRLPKQPLMYAAGMSSKARSFSRQLSGAFSMWGSHLVPARLVGFRTLTAACFISLQAWNDQWTRLVITRQEFICNSTLALLSLLTYLGSCFSSSSFSHCIIV